MNNLLSYCGLVDARISASEKDLPVPYTILFSFISDMIFSSIDISIHTGWSVNDGLSGNLLETSGNSDFPEVSAGFRIIHHPHGINFSL